MLAFVPFGYQNVSPSGGRRSGKCVEGEEKKDDALTNRAENCSIRAFPAVKQTFLCAGMLTAERSGEKFSPQCDENFTAGR